MRRKGLLMVLALLASLLVPVLAVATQSSGEGEVLPMETQQEGEYLEGEAEYQEEDSGGEAFTPPVDITPLVSVMEQVRDALICLFVVVSFTGGAVLGCSMGNVMRGLFG